MATSGLRAATLGTLLGLLLSAETCVGILLNPIDPHGQAFTSAEDWVQPGTAASLCVVAVTAAAVMLATLRRQQRAGLEAEAIADFSSRVGHRASWLFGAFFALFTYWCFAWTEARSPLWLAAWFLGAWLLTRAACRGATWLALRSRRNVE